MIHTSNLSQYAIVINRYADLYVRPQSINKKKYREPIKIERIWFKSKADAIAFKQQYDRIIP